MKEYLKQNKVRVAWVVAILTAILDIPAFFLLPETMVVQVGLTGEATSLVDKNLYLFLVTLVMAFLAYLNTVKKDDPRLNLILLNILLFLVHFFVMGINLMM